MTVQTVEAMQCLSERGAALRCRRATVSKTTMFENICIGDAPQAAGGGCGPTAAAAAKPLPPEPLAQESATVSDNDPTGQDRAAAWFAEANREAALAGDMWVVLPWRTVADWMHRLNKGVPPEVRYLGQARRERLAMAHAAYTKLAFMARELERDIREACAQTYKWVEPAPEQPTETGEQP